MRHTTLEDLIFLTQTDTTIGFVSKNAQKLTEQKLRPPHKHYIKAVNSLKTLSRCTRVPSLHKKRLRRSRKTTYIMPNGYAYRVVKSPSHLLLLDRLEWCYTTSANLSGMAYDQQFAYRAADIIVTPLQGDRQPSSIYKLGKTTLKRIR